MSEQIPFKCKIGGKIEVKPEQVREVRKVNGACTDLVLEGGKVERVKGNYYKAMEKLGKPVRPEGLEKLEGDWWKGDRKLKKFANC